MPVKSGGKPKPGQSDAMNYFMKKAGKSVEESDDDDDFSDDEEADIPVVDNSQTSVDIGAGLISAKP